MTERPPQPRDIDTELDEALGVLSEGDQQEARRFIDGTDNIAEAVDSAVSNTDSKGDIETRDTIRASGDQGVYELKATFLAALRQGKTVTEAAALAYSSLEDHDTGGVEH